MKGFAPWEKSLENEIPEIPALIIYNTISLPNNQYNKQGERTMKIPVWRRNPNGIAGFPSNPPTKPFVEPVAFL
jgi:hypothetical protein